MARGFDTEVAIKSTLEGISQLKQSLPLILCTHSCSLYDCLVKLGTTHETNSMIFLWLLPALGIWNVLILAEMSNCRK